MTRPDYWQHCTVDCERVVYCVVCGTRKPPLGRDVGVYAASGYCPHECSGHYLDPQPGHLFPGELAEMDAPDESE